MTESLDRSDAMTERLAEIKKRAEAATAGPWGARQVGHKSYVPGEPDDWNSEILIESPKGLIAQFPDTEEDAADALFIAHAREDIPYLLDRIAEMEAVLQKIAILPTSIECDRCGDCAAGHLRFLARTCFPEQYPGIVRFANPPHER